MPKLKKKKNESAHLDWIACLARDNASNNDGSGAQILSKEDRKRKRESKKNRRMEQQKQKQFLRLEQQRRRQKLLPERPSEYDGSQRSSKPLAKAHAISSGSSSSIQKQSRSLTLRELSKSRLGRLSKNIQAILKDVYEKNGSRKTRHRPYYDLPRNISEKGPRTSHSYGEAASSTKRKKRKWNENSIQPSKSDYSGIGLARISMYIEFLDPSYYPKLEEEFQEHIPGFFGKQRTKAMKKQTDGNMLWRRLANEKKNNNRTLKGMTADERVKAIINSSDGSGLLG